MLASRFSWCAFAFVLAMVAVASCSGGDSDAQRQQCAPRPRGSETGKPRHAELTSVGDLVRRPDRWAARLVIVEGQLYKFPGDRVTSERVQDQLVCDRIARFPPRGGSHCIQFWGLRVQEVPGARRSPDGGWWVKRQVRLTGTLHGYPHPPFERVALDVSHWRLVVRGSSVGG